MVSTGFVSLPLSESCSVAASSGVTVSKLTSKTREEVVEALKRDVVGRWAGGAVSDTAQAREEPVAKRRRTGGSAARGKSLCCAAGEPPATRPLATA